MGCVQKNIHDYMTGISLFGCEISTEPRGRDINLLSRGERSKSVTRRRIWRSRALVYAPFLSCICYNEIHVAFTPVTKQSLVES